MLMEINQENLPKNNYFDNFAHLAKFLLDKYYTDCFEDQSHFYKFDK